MLTISAGNYRLWHTLSSSFKFRPADGEVQKFTVTTTAYLIPLEDSSDYVIIKYLSSKEKDELIKHEKSGYYKKT